MTGLVAKRYYQKEIIDYDEYFALFVPFEVILLVIRKYVAMGWYVYHAGISTAF